MKILDFPAGEYGSSNLTDAAGALIRRTGTEYLNEIMARLDRDNIDYEALDIFEKIFPIMSYD
jgi:hypothetical protein